MVVRHSQNGNYALVEVNDLITELPASRNNSYLYLGQYNDIHTSDLGGPKAGGIAGMSL